jgi:short-subunit dehydrogenase
MVRRGEGHVVITGSATGYVPTPGLSAYSAVKHALHALAEMLRSELSGTGVGVSLICPGTVRTGIYRSERNRPAERPGPSHGDPTVLRRYQEAVDASPTTPEAVAAAAIDAIVADRFYVLPSPEVLPMLAERWEALGRALAADAAGEPRPGGPPVD